MGEWLSNNFPGIIGFLFLGIVIAILVLFLIVVIKNVISFFRDVLKRNNTKSKPFDEDIYLAEQYLRKRGYNIPDDWTHYQHDPTTSRPSYKRDYMKLNVSQVDNPAEKPIIRKTRIPIPFIHLVGVELVFIMLDFKQYRGIQIALIVGSVLVFAVYNILAKKG